MSQRYSKLVGIKLELAVYEQLAEYAEGLGLSPGTAARKLVETALAGELGDQVARDLEAEGYRDGLAKANARVKQALTKLWKEGL